MALAVSVLLHLTLFVAVRWEPAGFGGSRGVTMLHLHLIEEATEPAAPIAAAEAARPAPPAAAAPAAPTRREDPEVAGEQALAIAEAPPVQPVASAPPASAPAPVETPAAIVPSTAAPEPTGRAAAVGQVAAVAQVAADARASDQAQSPQEGAPAGAGVASSPAGQGQEPAAATAGFARADAAPNGGALGPGAEAGEPGGAPDLGAVRRRIDERKVYPRVAVRNGWEGRVLVEVRLDGDGGLAAVRLVQGSGHSVLDDATLTAVRRAAPFPPVARIITVPVEYRLIP